MRFLPLIELRDHDGSAERGAEIALFVDGAGGREEAAGVQIVVAEEFVGGAVKNVGAGFRDEGDHAAAGLSELCFEAVGIDGELGDGFDGGREIRGLAGVGRSGWCSRKGRRAWRSNSLPDRRRATSVLPLPLASATWRPDRTDCAARRRRREEVRPPACSAQQWKSWHLRSASGWPGPAPGPIRVSWPTCSCASARTVAPGGEDDVALDESAEARTR